MARFFDCSIGDLFDLQETAIPLSKEEKRLIALFADLNDDGNADYYENLKKVQEKCDYISRQQNIHL